MGNYVSCALTTGSSGTQSHRSTKVILPDNTIRHLTGPAPYTAAELMLDAPGHFLVSSRSMHVGRRFSPLTADEELEIGHVYVMLPMARVNSVVTTTDVGRLLVVADNAVRKATGGRARILPETTSEMKLDRVRVGSVGEEFGYRLSVCRSRRPGLETIAEETVCSR